MLLSLLLFINTNLKYNLRIILSSLIWCIALFTHEQITGLVIVFFILQLGFQKERELYKKCYNALIKVSPIFITTMIFMALYFSLDSNPKLDVVKEININKTEKLNDENIEFYNKKRSNRSFFIRINQLINFYLLNLLYSLNNLFSSGFRGLLILFITIILVLSTRYKISNHNQNTFNFIGLTWFIVTMMPFALFRGFHIPVYNLLLPAVGLSIIIYNLITKIFKNNFLTYSIIIKLFIFSSIINQYGIFFGLKEELSYWENVGNRLKPYKKELLNGNEVLINNINEKKNKHIFWLERANGYRHLNNKVGIGNLMVIKKPNSTELLFKKNIN